MLKSLDMLVQMSIMTSFNKRFFLTLLFSTLLFGDIATKYAEGLTKAIQTNKKLFILVYDTKSTQARNYYDRLTNDEDLLMKLSHHYQLVILDKNSEQFPKRYLTKYPITTFLITPPSEIEDEMILGAVNPIKLLRIAVPTEF